MFFIQRYLLYIACFDNTGLDFKVWLSFTTYMAYLAQSFKDYDDRSYYA